MTRLLYFAWVKEKVGKSPPRRSTLPSEVATVAELIAWLKTRGTGIRQCVRARRTLSARPSTRSHVRHDARIGAAREIAFFPPVTGG